MISIKSVQQKEVDDMLKNMKQSTNLKFIPAFMMGTAIYVVGTAINLVRDKKESDESQDSSSSDYQVSERKPNLVRHS